MVKKRIYSRNAVTTVKVDEEGRLKISTQVKRHVHGVLARVMQNYPVNENIGSFRDYKA